MTDPKILSFLNELGTKPAIVCDNGWLSVLHLESVNEAVANYFPGLHYQLEDPTDSFCDKWKLVVEDE